MTRSLRLTWPLGAGLALAACVGNIGDPPPGKPPGEAQGPVCDGVQPGESPIRRMTRFEYNNTVRDLLGDNTNPADEFVAEEEALGFNNQATALGVTQLLAEQYMEASEKIAANAAKDLTKLLPCDPAAIGEDACAKQFINVFGGRAYRRPISGEDLIRLDNLYLWGKSEFDFSTGIQLVIQAMLQSTRFLYRVELGLGSTHAGDVTRSDLQHMALQKAVIELDSYEIASRLSYLFWGSMPDEELFAAAAAGKLGTPEEIKAQAERMLEDPRARAAVDNFHAQWLGLHTVDTFTKDPAVYPSFDDALRPLWQAETLGFLQHVVFDGEGDVSTMFTAPYSFMNAELAAFYGVQGPSGEAFEKVDVDPAQRSGFLTHASVLAINAKPNQSSPVHRGKFVRERLLCQILPPPPNDVVIVAPDVDPNATTREKFAQHSEDPACASCHRLMDPIGFGFEHYDGVGAWRDTDHGFPVDASGEVLGSRDADGPFDGAVELGARLADSDQVRQCVATQWFRFGYGRAEHDDDQCTMKKLQQAFADSGFNIKGLLIALTQTDAFRYRRAVVPGK